LNVGNGSIASSSSINPKKKNNIATYL